MTVETGAEQTATTRSVRAGAPFVPSGRVIDAIAEHLNLGGETTAVISADGVLSWSDLALRVQHLVTELDSKSIGPGDRVVVACRASAAIPAMLAALQLGAAYVPLDPDYQRGRHESLLADATPSIVLHDETFDPLPGHASLDIALVASSSPTPGSRPLAAARPAGDDETAYVMYTSGSTGVPRGVPVSHASLDWSIGARAKVYGRDPSCFLLLSSISFDSSIVGLFWTLSTKGTVLVPRTPGDIDEVLQTIERHSPTHLLTVPARYRQLLARSTPAQRAHWPLDCIVAGEACHSPLVQEHHRLVPSSVMTNEYGPTETSVWATSHILSPDDEPVPLGDPVPGSWVAVVGTDDRPLPFGTEGELIIGGPGVTSGYTNDVEATEARFGVSGPDDAFLPPGPFFRSGDLATMTAETLFFRGRKDNQLNIGGIRLEPGEIEAALARHPNVFEAIVTAHDTRPLTELMETAGPTVVGDAIRESATTPDPQIELLRLLRKAVPGDPRLVAHVEVLGEIDSNELRRLAAVSAPSGIHLDVVTHSSLPRLDNGKVDRRRVEQLPLDIATPATKGTATAAAAAPSSAPVDAVETIVDVYRTLLDNPSIGPDDDFFEAGGYSLLVIDALTTIEGRLGVQLDTTAIYDYPSARALAGALGGDETTGTLNRALVMPVQPNGDEPPMFALFNLGADGEYIRPLAAELGNDQPFFGLGPTFRIEEYRTDVWEPEDVYDSDAIAAAYVPEIERLAPGGRVRLLGICGGVPVAYQTAIKLRERGVVVELLVIVNDWHSPNLPDDPRLDMRSELEIRRQYVASMGLGPYLRQLAHHPATRGKRRLEQLRLRRAERTGKPLSRTLRIRRFIEEGLARLHDHDYAPYDGSVLVVRGNDVPRFQVPEADESWDGILGNYSIAKVPGRGILTMQPPHVSSVADAIRGVLAKETSAGPASGSHRALAEGMQSGDLRRTLVRLRSQPLSSTDANLLNRVETIGSELARQSAAEAHRLADALSGAHSGVRPVPVPALMTFPICLLAVDGGQQARADLVPSLAELGYCPDPDDENHEFFTRPGTDALRLHLVERGLASDDPKQAIEPFLDTPNSLVDALLGFAQIEASDVVIDLGCGDGRLLIAAAQSKGCRAVGYELDARRAAEARAAAIAAGVDALVTIHNADFRTGDFNEGDVVLGFLPPDSAAMALGFALEAVPNCRHVVMHELASVDWPVPPDEVRVLTSEPGAPDALPAVTVAARWTRLRAG